MFEVNSMASNRAPKYQRNRLGVNSTVRLFAGLLCGLTLAQEIDASKTTSQNKSNVSQTAQEEPLQGSYEAARQSLGWMTRSLQQMADKLDSISSKLDPNASEEEINREVKRAMREAFSDFMPGSVIPNPAKISAPVAEVDANAKTFDSPIWDRTTPAWVKDRIVDQEVVRMAIESSVESSLEECRLWMDDQQSQLVQKVIDEHVLQYAKASQIEQLTPEYLIGKLIRPDTQYELMLDRPSGTYHQLFRLVHIGPDQIKEIRRWEREFVTAQRVQWISGSAFGALMLLASASGITGIMARRSQASKGKPIL
jgi:hypothetical protein